MRLSSSNRTAVTCGIGGSDVEVTAAVRKKSGFVFERPLSAQSIRNTLKPAYGLILSVRVQFTLRDHEAPFLAGSNDLLVEDRASGGSLRPFRTSTSPNHRSGCHTNWKRRYRNSSPDNSER